MSGLNLVYPLSLLLPCLQSHCMDTYKYLSLQSLRINQKFVLSGMKLKHEEYQMISMLDCMNANDVDNNQKKTEEVM